MQKPDDCLDVSQIGLTEEDEEVAKRLADDCGYAYARGTLNLKELPGPNTRRKVERSKAGVARHQRRQ